MIGRSLLFVPADNDRKLEKSVTVGADVLIFDLEDSVAEEHKTTARVRVREFISGLSGCTAKIWVRINALDGPNVVQDLTEVLPARPHGVVVPKVNSARDLVRLGHYLDVLEVQNGLRCGHTRVLPVVTETPQSLFELGGYRACTDRLGALMWGAEDLSAAVGASANRDEHGDWLAPFKLVRSLCLFGAHAAGVGAIDSIFADFRNLSGLRAECNAARRDGFSGKAAIHPDQVSVINECFTPSEEEVVYARRIVALFAASPGVAALSIDGKMVDLPHLRQAENILSRVDSMVALKGQIP